MFGFVRNKLDRSTLRGCRISPEISCPFGHAYRIVEWLDEHGCVVRRAIGATTSLEAVADLIHTPIVGNRYILKDDEPLPPARLPRRRVPKSYTPRDERMMHVLDENVV